MKNNKAMPDEWTRDFKPDGLGADPSLDEKVGPLHQLGPANSAFLG